MHLSLEIFPPRDDDQQATLQHCLQQLRSLQPEYVSVTFGAGGSTLDRTRSTVLQLRQQFNLPAVPHVSCMVPDADSVNRMLDEYLQHGINRLVLLRGDRPDEQVHSGPFQYAEDLVRHVRQRYGGQFAIEVGCYPELHPESPCAQSELNYLKRKIDAGACAAITQYFFNADAYFQLLDDCAAAGINVPITPGIMPITNYQRLARFSSMCGAEIPRWLGKRLQSFDDDAALRDFGSDFVCRLCERLLQGGAPGLHFYTLNRASATLDIVNRLLPDRRRLLRTG